MSALIPACASTRVADAAPQVLNVPQVDAAYQALEEAIDVRRDNEAQRLQLYRAAQRACDDGSALSAFLRAAAAGRLAEVRGLSAIGLVRESERWARQALIRDPGFRDGEAQRLLGSLLALAGHHVAGLDVEEGIAMLEELVKRQPDNPVNHLRLAQALQAAGDDESAIEPLCVAIAGETQLRAAEQRLLYDLTEQSGGRAALACGSRR